MCVDVSAVNKFPFFWCRFRQSTTSSAVDGATPSSDAENLHFVAQLVITFIYLAESLCFNNTNRFCRRHAIQISKALGVAELILHDEKYRVVVQNTPDLINRILALLDAVQTSGAFVDIGSGSNLRFRCCAKIVVSVFNHNHD
jgi:hypothetical protein